MTIDTTKITPEKLAEMNDSLIVDNNHLRGRVAALTKERDDLLAWQQRTFDVHPNIDLDIG